MSKVIKLGDEAHSAIIKGIDAVANIVKTTLGPKGKNVLIRNHISPPIITNDGVTIAKAIELKDNAEDAGAQLIIQAANKTNMIAGDGTTTTTLLAQEIIHGFYNYFELEADDAENINEINVIQVQKDMIEASEEISDYLKSMAKPITGNSDIEKIATISSGSEHTGKLLAEAFDKAGEYGSVTVEVSKNGKDEISVIQGMKLTNGSISPYLLSDRLRGKSDISNVSVLITKDRIDSIQDIFAILELCLRTDRKLLIICDDIEYEPLSAIINNKSKVNVSVIGLPGFGELRESLIEDICIATGATLMGREENLPLKDVSVSYLGEISQAIITMDDTILKFVDKKSDGHDLLKDRQDRVEAIKSVMANKNHDELEQYNRRIANLVGGLAVYRVGGNSDVETEDRKLRLEDAINSICSSMEEGIVVGGGYSFMDVYDHVDLDKLSLGKRLVYQALCIVAIQIAENAGYDGIAVAKKCSDLGLGFNALTGNYENLLETGVVNSVKVDRYSLINAVSVASSVITMNGLIVEENEKDHNILQLQAPTGLI